MNNRIKKLAIILGIAVVAGGPVFAKKPESPGNSAPQKSSQENSASSLVHRDSEDSQNYFNDDRRTLIRNYYSSKSRESGNCPPGLAKKNNGCQPPGQIKKWRKGEPLPNDIAYYDLPSALINELGRTPEGKKVVQVGTALLLISIGTGMVLDTFELQE